MKIKIKKIEQKGLTLVETTVALGIIMIGVLASIVLMLATFNFSQKSKYELVVVNLSRNGIEMVRSMRNSGSIDLFSGNYDNMNFIVDSRDNFNLETEADDVDISYCDNCRLYFKDNRYLHDDTGEATEFKRIIKIRNVPGNEKKIISEISWTHKNKNYSFILESSLTDWPETIRLFN